MISVINNNPTDCPLPSGNATPIVISGIESEQVTVTVNGMSHVLDVINGSVSIDAKGIFAAVSTPDNMPECVFAAGSHIDLARELQHTDGHASVNIKVDEGNTTIFDQTFTIIHGIIDTDNISLTMDGGFISTGREERAVLGIEYISVPVPIYESPLQYKLAADITYLGDDDELHEVHKVLDESRGHLVPSVRNYCIDFDKLAEELQFQGIEAEMVSSVSLETAPAARWQLRLVNVPARRGDRIFLFRNTFGGLDTVVSQGAIADKINFDEQYFIAGGAEREIGNASKKVVSVNTGRIAAWDAEQWMEFFKSDVHYIIDDGSARRIIISDVNAEFNKSQYGSATFKYRLAEDKGRRIDR